MNDLSFGSLLLKMLGVALPTALFVILLLCSVVCAFGSIKHARKIQGQESMSAFKSAWILWLIGLAALVLCGLSGQVGSVSMLMDGLGDSVKRAFAQFLATAYFIPVAVILWRTGLEILKRLSR